MEKRTYNRKVSSTPKTDRLVGDLKKIIDIAAAYKGIGYTDGETVEMMLHNIDMVHALAAKTIEK